jgi:hypothetical protein
VVDKLIDGTDRHFTLYYKTHYSKTLLSQIIRYKNAFMDDNSHKQTRKVLHRQVAQNKSHCTATATAKMCKLKSLQGRKKHLPRLLMRRLCLHISVRQELGLSPATI